MLFNSLNFILFFLIVYALYWILPHRWQNCMLLLASYVFYGSWDYRFLSLIMLSTAIDYYCSQYLRKSHKLSRRKTFLLISVVTNLTLLGIFKYFNFFSENFYALMSLFGIHTGHTTLHIILPIGISFYTFQTLSYTIDVYRQKLAPERNIVNFALFVSFFPQLVAGPIERASHFLPQIQAPRCVTCRQIGHGLWLIFWGFFLKIFVADNLAPMVDNVFSTTGPYDGAQVLFAVYAFAFQIFGDFAGYSSIAIGLALLMGFSLTPNFLCPYLVTNPRNFWRHWHITLSRWFRDYLYIPLGGNRASTRRVCGNLLLTMALAGLWHGAAWTFILWGAYHGVLLIGYRLCEIRRSPNQHSTSKWLGNLEEAIKMVLMFHLTCFGWMIFRAQSIEQVWQMSACLTELSLLSSTAITHFLDLAFYIWIVILFQVIQRRSHKIITIYHIPYNLRPTLIISMIYLLLIWGNYGGSEFIYFQF